MITAPTRQIEQIVHVAQVRLGLRSPIDYQCAVTQNCEDKCRKQGLHPGVSTCNANVTSQLPAFDSQVLPTHGILHNVAALKDYLRTGSKESN